VDPAANETKYPAVVGTSDSATHTVEVAEPQPPAAEPSNAAASRSPNLGHHHPATITPATITPAAGPLTITAVGVTRTSGTRRA